MNKLIISSIVLSFVLFGCAGSGPLLKPDQGSRFAYISKHPELSVDIQQAIQDGRVIKGMTKEDVEATWGKPSSIENFNADPKAWWYEKNGEGWWYKTFVGSTYFVEFNCNRVSQIDSYFK